MNPSRDIELLFKKYYRQLCIYAMHFVHEVTAAEDIVQDAFLGLWQKRNEIQDVRAYLFASVRNRSITRVRKLQITSTGEVPEILSEEILEADTEREAQVWAALDTLSPKRRQAFLMSRRDGMTYEEIAACMGVSLHTVRNHIAKATKRLKLFLENSSL